MKWIICEEDCRACPFAEHLACPPGDKPRCEWCAWAPVCPCSNPSRSPERAAKLLAKMGKTVEGLVFLPPEMIEPPLFPLREGMNQARLKELAHSMKSDLGMVEPLVVRPTTGGGVQLVVGSRRLAAAKLARFKAIGCRIKELGDREALLFSLVENLQREDLTWAEEARGLARLQQITHWSGREIARRIGKSHRWVNERLQARATLEKAGVEPTEHKVTRPVSPEQPTLPIELKPVPVPPLQAVTAVAKVPELDKKRELLTEVIEEGLTEEETKARVAEVLEEPALGTTPLPVEERPAASPPALQRLVDEGLITKGPREIPLTRAEVLYLSEIVIRLNIEDFLHRHGMRTYLLPGEPVRGKSLAERAMELVQDLPLGKLKEVLFEEAGRVLAKFEPGHPRPYFNNASQATVKRDQASEDD